MMAPNFNNTSPVSALDGAINDTVTSLDVTAGDGTDFPSVEFNISIRDEAGTKVPEVCRVTVVATDTFTITRGYDNTTAQSWSDGDIVEHVVIAEDMDKAWSITNLDDLDDVNLTTTTPSSGDLLKYQIGVYNEVTSPVPSVTVESIFTGSGSNTIDGDTITYWRSDSYTSSTNVWIAYNFGQDVTLSRIKLLQNYSGEEIASVFVQTSTDGSSWSTIATVSTVLGWNNLDFTRATSRYWRLLDNSGSFRRWRIHEVEFYDSPNEWVPASPPPLTTKGDIHTYSTDDARLPVGTDEYTLFADSIETTGLKWAAIENVASLQVAGTLTTGVVGFRWYAPFALTILAVEVSVGTAPTDADLICDVNKAGTTIYTTQANRPTVTASGYVSGDAVPDVTAMVDGDYLQLEVDQIGSTIAGADLIWTIRYRRTP